MEKFIRSYDESIRPFKMEIFILFLFTILAISVIGRNLFSSAKRNLFRDQAAWSGKDIKIKYNNKRKFSESNAKDNYLKTIADESKIFLEEHSNNKNEEIK